MLIRTLSIFVGLLALAGVIARLSGAAFDPTMLWVDLRLLPGAAGTLLLMALVVTIGLRLFGRSARMMAIVPATVALLALANTIDFYRLIAAGVVQTGAMLPVTLFAVVGMVWIARDFAYRCEMSSPRHARGYLRRAGIVAGVGAWAIVFALGQMWCFGRTDYARPADAVVVFGARTYADGRLSSALQDRVRTGVELYHQGLAPRLIMSGGPGDGTIDEPTAMRDFAVSLGVPISAITLDPDGLNTRGTIRTLTLLPEHSRVLAVSHFYHLPRVKLAAHQAGINVFTVPAREAYALRAMPRYIAREVAAFWVYLASDA